MKQTILTFITKVNPDRDCATSLVFSDNLDVTVGPLSNRTRLLVRLVTSQPATPFGGSSLRMSRRRDGRRSRGSGRRSKAGWLVGQYGSRL